MPSRLLKQPDHEIKIQVYGGPTGYSGPAHLVSVERDNLSKETNSVIVDIPGARVYLPPSQVEIVR